MYIFKWEYVFEKMWIIFIVYSWSIVVTLWTLRFTMALSYSDMANFPSTRSITQTHLESQFLVVIGSVKLYTNFSLYEHCAEPKCHSCFPNTCCFIFTCDVFFTKKWNESEDLLKHKYLNLKLCGVIEENIPDHHVTIQLYTRRNGK